MTKRRSGLGRGLDALLRSEEEGLRSIPLDLLKPNRVQPRAAFDESGLQELADSIRQHGIVQPLVVRSETDGGYTIVAGERRWRAARRAGLEEVPAVVREVSGEQQLLEMALVENLQRADLNPMEEAEAFESLQRSSGLAQEEIGRRVGKGRSTVANAVRLLKLPDEVQDLLRDGRLTAGQARPLLGLDAESAVKLALRAVEQGLNARQMEKLASQGPRKRRQKPAVDPDTAAAEERLTRRLQTPVSIRRRGARGAVRIHFHGEEELMRIFELLIGAGRD